MGFFDRPELDDDESEDWPDFDAETSPWIGGVVPTEFVLARFTIRSFIHHSGKRTRGRPFGFRHWDDDELPSDYLRVGVAWPDGGRATNTASRWTRDRTDARARRGGGSGSDREYEWNFHAWPLPEDAELLFVVEWPEFGIGETSTPVEASLLQDAARRARPVWDQDADRPHRLSRAAVMARFQESG